MTPEQLDQLCADAMARIEYFVARMCAQNMRRMRESWSRYE